jgi:DNA-binding NtrC family response regulator
VDLVISDLRMDEMDGMQLFTEIQKQQPGMPVIISPPTAPSRMRSPQPSRGYSAS